MALEDAIAVLEKEIINELSRLGMPNLTEPLFTEGYTGKVEDLQKETRCSVCGEMFMVVMVRIKDFNHYVPEHYGFYWSTKRKDESAKYWALCSETCTDVFDKFTELISREENESWQQLWYAKRILKQARLLVREKSRGV